MTKPSLKDKLNAQRSAGAAATPVDTIFRQDETVEPRVRTSMYLPESLAKQLKILAAERRVRTNDLVIDAIASYVKNAEEL